MFLKHLINPKPTIILFFIVFCILFICFPLIKYPLGLVYSHKWISPVFVLLISLLIQSFHALGINNLIYEKNIIRKDNLVIGFVFIMLCTPFLNTVSEWVISFFLLFFLNYILETYQKEYPFAQVFNAGLIISILSFISPNLLFLMPIIFVSGINYTNINWRNILTACIGVVIPYLFYFIYAFLFDITFYFPDFNNLKIISFNSINEIQMPKLIWLSILIVISLISFIELFKWLYKKSICSRKSFMIIFFYFIFITLLIIFGGLNSWYFLMTPLCVIIGNYFIHTKNRKIGDLLFLLLMTSSLYCRYSIVL